MSKLTKTEAEIAEQHGQKSIENSTPEGLEVTDSLTESDIKAIEKKLLAKFNSRFADFAKRIMDNPPTSAAAIVNLRTEFSRMYGFTDSIAKTMTSLNELKID